MTTRLLCVPLLVVPAIAFAQAPPQPMPSTRSAHPLVYEVFAGATELATTGRLRNPPPSAPAPPANAVTGSVGMGLGVDFTPRIMFLGQFDVIAGQHVNTGGGSWGALDLFASARFQPVRRARLEIGVGAAELGYQPPSNISVTVTRYWSTAARVGVGYDVFRGPQVNMSLYARASTADLEGLAMRTVSVQLAITGRYWP